MEVSLFNKKIWLSWIFKGSALLQINAIILILFVLIQTREGSFIDRSHFIANHEDWVLLSWISSIVAIFSIVGTFSVFTFMLNHTYRPILYCAWFISVVGAIVAFLEHFIKMTIMPILWKWLTDMPSIHLSDHIYEWEWMLDQLAMLIIPSCFALSGFFYTAVMFCTTAFPRGLSWWSFSIWSTLLMGVVFLREYDWLYLLYAALVLFSYVPWLWVVSEVWNKSKKSSISYIK